MNESLNNDVPSRRCEGAEVVSSDSELLTFGTRTTQPVRRRSFALYRGTNFFVEPSETTTSISNLPVKETRAAKRAMNGGG